jgi:alkylation response protein AidB-like acyl-CoA dehydrogenase
MQDALFTSERREIVERMTAAAVEFPKRSFDSDRDATFPYENWEDLKAAGLLGICIPKENGGLGGDFVAYALASEELGRHCATTGLTFNMHVATTLMVGQIADDMDLPDDVRATQHERREQLWHGVVNNHTIHSQPFSEGTAASATGGFATMAKKVDGGYLVNGRKIFASLSGAANIHNVVCISDVDDQLHLMGVPADADGVTIEGGWDPLGMRGTDSPGMFEQAAWRWPYFYMTLSFSYLGLMRSILDYTSAYLRGEHGTSARRDSHIKQHGWADMQLTYDRAQALCYRVLGEVSADPTRESLRRAWTSMVTTMQGAPELASKAIEIAGGRSMLRPSLLEQAYRDSRAGATMLPWSVEVCLDRLGRFDLYPESDRFNG